MLESILKWKDVLTNVPSDLDFPNDIFQLPAGIRRAGYWGLGSSISPRAGRSRVVKDMGCAHMKGNRPTTSGMITSAFAVPREWSYSSYHEWRDSVFHLTELSCGLVLLHTLDLCLLGVNGVPFVQSFTCAGILTGYQSICGIGGHKK